MPKFKNIRTQFKVVDKVCALPKWLHQEVQAPKSRRWIQGQPSWDSTVHLEHSRRWVEKQHLPLGSVLLKARGVEFIPWAPQPVSSQLYFSSAAGGLFKESTCLSFVLLQAKVPAFRKFTDCLLPQRVYQKHLKLPQVIYVTSQG